MMSDWNDNSDDEWLFNWKFWVVFALACIPCVLYVISEIGG